MAIKYFCDGCDKQLQIGKVETMNVHLQKHGSVTVTEQKYELCAHCFTELKSKADPRNWPRARPEAKTA